MKQVAVLLLAVTLSGSSIQSSTAGDIRTKTHEDYIATLWHYVQHSNYQSWPQAEEFIGLGVGPWLGQKTFLNDKGNWSEGSILISETWHGEELGGISIFLKQRAGYSTKSKDWYWVHFAADGTVVSASPDKEAHRKAGFVSWVVEGRLWVFNITSAEAADFVKGGEPAKSVTRPGAGPGRMTVRSSDNETIEAFIATKPGFFVWPVDGRLWVFRSGSAEIAAFLTDGELARSVTRPGAGPGGVTLRSEDSETIEAYVTARAGFETAIVDGRLWVFETGSEDFAEFQANGELAKSVTRPGAGPGGITIRSADSETIDKYLVAKEGFETFFVEGRLWVFRTGSEDLAEFKANGELAKSVTRPAAGPGGVTVRSADSATIDAYLN